MMTDTSERFQTAGAVVALLLAFFGVLALSIPLLYTGNVYRICDRTTAGDLEGDTVTVPFRGTVIGAFDLDDTRRSGQTDLVLVQDYHGTGPPATPNAQAGEGVCFVSALHDGEVEVASPYGPEIRRTGDQVSVGETTISRGGTIQVQTVDSDLTHPWRTYEITVVASYHDEPLRTYDMVYGDRMESKIRSHPFMDVNGTEELSEGGNVYNFSEPKRAVHVTTWVESRFRIVTPVVFLGLLATVVLMAGKLLRSES